MRFEKRHIAQNQMSIFLEYPWILVLEESSLDFVVLGKRAEIYSSFPIISSELGERIKRPTVCLGAEKMNAGSTASCATTGGKIRYD